MTPEYIDRLSSKVKTALSQMTELQAERDFLLRVIKQAVLTHGGTLKVDVAHAEAAKRDDGALIFGAGEVRLLLDSVGVSP